VRRPNTPKRTAAQVEAERARQFALELRDIFLEGDGAPDAEWRLSAATEQIKRIMKASNGRKQLPTNGSILY
jgi:hypothetical protein